MRVAALYDVHGNMPALEAVLADTRLRDADVVVSGGDVCAGPMPAEVLLALRNRGALFVRGNADRELTGWPAEKLARDELEVLRSWPTALAVEVDGLGPVVFCHGSPRRDDEILTRITPAEAVEEACAGAQLVVCGHTHVQFDRTLSTTRVVNAGSVGMPYEGHAAAFWALLGPEVELVNTRYGIAAAVEAIRRTGYTQADDLIAGLISPHSAEEATAFFETQRGA